MMPNVSFNNLRHQSIHRSATGRDSLQYAGTVISVGQHLFNGIHLPTNPPDTVDQFLEDNELYEPSQPSIYLNVCLPTIL